MFLSIIKNMEKTLKILSRTRQVLNVKTKRRGSHVLK